MNTVNNRLLVNGMQASDEIRFAIVHNNVLENVFIEHPGSQKKSNIYKGIVTRIEPSLQAAFVDFGSDRHGFLPFKEVSESFHKRQYRDNENISINDVLTEGQDIMIQVDKEERGNKGAALTTYISLAGSYLVLMPNNPRAGGISRRIEGDERDELKNILNLLSIADDMGLIIRTAGLGKSPAELQWDLNILISLWDAIKSAYQQFPAPRLIHQESDIITRAIRDYLRDDIDEILIDNADIFQKAKQYIEQVRPEFLDKVKLYQDKIPLFTRFYVENQIETAYQTEVRLPSGGSIVIQPTEALVSIDVNSSRDTKGGHIEQTAYNTNREAAIEIARQLRLRDVGGLIVIDFIDMMSKDNQESIVDIFTAESSMDKARVQIGRISKFGLLEISRQRLRPSLSESNQIICPRCVGQGSIRSVKSLALHILRILREDAMQEGINELIVQLPVSVATYILNEKRVVVTDIETQHKVLLRVIPNPHFEPPHYKIEKIREDHGRGDSHRKASYTLVSRPAPDLSMFAEKSKQIELEPAVSVAIPKRPDELGKPIRKHEGIIKKVWQTLFGGEIRGKGSKPVVREAEDSEDIHVKSQTLAHDERRPQQHHRNKHRQHRRMSGKNTNYQRTDRRRTGYNQKSYDKSETGADNQNYSRQSGSADNQNSQYNRQSGTGENQNQNYNRQSGAADNQNQNYNRQSGTADNQNQNYNRQSGTADNQNPNYNRQSGTTDNQNPNYNRQSDNQSKNYSRQYTNDKPRRHHDRDQPHHGQSSNESRRAVEPKERLPESAEQPIEHKHEVNLQAEKPIREKPFHAPQEKTTVKPTAIQAPKVPEGLSSAFSDKPRIEPKQVEEETQGPNFHAEDRFYQQEVDPAFKPYRSKHRRTKAPAKPQDKGKRIAPRTRSRKVNETIEVVAVESSNVKKISEADEG